MLFRAFAHAKCTHRRNSMDATGVQERSEPATWGFSSSRVNARRVSGPNPCYFVERCAWAARTDDLAWTDGPRRAKARNSMAGRRARPAGPRDRSVRPGGRPMRVTHLGRAASPRDRSARARPVHASDPAHASRCFSMGFRSGRGNTATLLPGISSDTAR